MTEETEKVSKGKKADVGDTINILSGSEKGKKGRVIVVRDNSVIVELGINPKKDEPIKTVISHKRYKVVK
ncbi:DUF2187 family protein [Cytobacillus oceanisediminis]|uniref:DUF2187 family protein n=1 Tax=Cytobacillus oceanisediminis TaxID=665099 RepID=UPI001C24499A|nr:DUF2187 family protein [Cytobacillus oceanisediminis]MBU8769735.1 YkvS family protein [Cytobacillus oceanisediminis]